MILGNYQVIISVKLFNSTFFCQLITCQLLSLMSGISLTPQMSLLE